MIPVSGCERGRRQPGTAPALTGPRTPCGRRVTANADVIADHSGPEANNGPFSSFSVNSGRVIRMNDRGPERFHISLERDQRLCQYVCVGTEFKDAPEKAPA